MYACIACCLLSMILVGVLSIDFYFQNRRADRDGKLLENTEVGRMAVFLCELVVKTLLTLSTGG